MEHTTFSNYKCELWCTCFITKTEVLFFLICALDSDFWERILSLNSHVSLFYAHVVVVVHQGNCWEEAELVDRSTELCLCEIFYFDFLYKDRQNFY